MGLLSKIGKAFGGWAGIAGAILSGLGKDRTEDKYGIVARADKEGEWALKLQNDDQEWQRFLADRKNVAGGPAHGGTSVVADVWGGMSDPAMNESVQTFFSGMNQSNSYDGGAGNISRAPDLQSYLEAGQGEVNAALDYGVRDEYDNPLFNLRNFLGLDTRRGYAPDGERANANAGVGNSRIFPGGGG